VDFLRRVTIAALAFVDWLTVERRISLLKSSMFYELGKYVLVTRYVTTSLVGWEIDPK
jgi:hypothetical protein